jgi:hypothetical protein
MGGVQEIHRRRVLHGVSVLVVEHLRGRGGSERGFERVQEEGRLLLSGGGKREDVNSVCCVEANVTDVHMGSVH